MSTLYLVIAEKGAKDINSKTRASIKEIMQEGDQIFFYPYRDDTELYYEIKSKIEGTFDYVCPIPNGGEVNISTPTIFKNYEEKDREEKILYMPLVVLSTKDTKGVLNACVWNTNIAEEVGVLTHNLARKQVDTTLYGCYIPFDLFFDEQNYSKDIKFYQHFYFLNKVTSNENNIVFGIPKTTLYTDVDLSFSHATNEEKIKHFKQAREINVEA